MSIFEDINGCSFIRMANLAIIGSHAVNGVSKIHSNLIVETLYVEKNSV